jgi:hypothetical protein
MSGLITKKVQAYSEGQLSLAQLAEFVKHFPYRKTVPSSADSVGGVDDDYRDDTDTREEVASAMYAFGLTAEEKLPVFEALLGDMMPEGAEPGEKEPEGEPAKKPGKPGPEKPEPKETPDGDDTATEGG